jgi:hypothetical protein
MQTLKLQHAYYSASVEVFLRDSPQTILGHLAEHHPHDLDPAQRMAWLGEINLLQRELPRCAMVGLPWNLPYRVWAGARMRS